MKLTAAEIIDHLGLAPLPGEGGYYRETHRSEDVIPPSAMPTRYAATRSRAVSTAIYYLITPDSFSRLHRLRSDEVYHYYLGDPAELVLLSADGQLSHHVLGPDLRAGQAVQMLVPTQSWQSLRLCADGAWTLVGTTVAPGFDFADWELADAAILTQHPTLVSQLRPLLADGRHRLPAVIHE